MTYLDKPATDQPTIPTVVTDLCNDDRHHDCHIRGCQCGCHILFPFAAGRNDTTVAAPPPAHDPAAERELLLLAARLAALELKVEELTALLHIVQRSTPGGPR